MNSRLRYKVANQPNRGSTSWSVREAVIVRLWATVWLLFARLTPKKLNVWRLFLLKMFGAKVRGRPFVFPSARIYVPWNVEILDGACLGPGCNVYSLGKVILRERCVISQEAYLCGGTHDFADKRFPLMVGDIDIGEDVFIGARAFVLPGVNLGTQSLVGAMAVVTKDVMPHAVVAGNPARVVGERRINED